MHVIFFSIASSIFLGNDVQATGMNKAPVAKPNECSSVFSQGSAMVRHRKPLKRILLSSPDETSLSSEDTNLMMNIQVKKTSTCMREKKNSQVELKKAGKKVKPNASVNTSIYANHNSFGKNTVATLSCM